ncbi:MAG: L,D-transpeptidase [Ferrovibrio sp.]|jgi:L,D-peptidoglycan transpeptidase YkuD (ErfK/YbiS/YcfS/YnhG family)|uniref:L,D-transpeptidase family protein n=1 Tax=Ferrovibrio sp. TaxID=1917215 RepID=UPI00391902CE
MSDIIVTSNGILRHGGLRFRCALGKGGCKPEADKREGDGATPLGRYALRQVYYRVDRLAAPDTRLPLQALTPQDGWCDDPGDPAYNRHVVLPFAASHEKLWREDSVYDVIVVLGHNDDPPVPGMGSAIFLHVARADYSGTEGCVALALSDLLALLAVLPPNAAMQIVSAA